MQVEFGSKRACKVVNIALVIKENLNLIGKPQEMISMIIIINLVLNIKKVNVIK